MNFKTPFERTVAERLVTNKIEELVKRIGWIENRVEPYYTQRASEFTHMCDDNLVYLSEILRELEGNLIRAEIILDSVQHEMEDGAPHNASGIIACSCPLPKKEKKTDA